MAYRNRLNSRLKRGITPEKVVWAARISLAAIYIWFGGLKLVAGGSPAEGFVMELWEVMFSFISFETFFLILGLMEVSLGVLFLIPQLSLVMLIGVVLHLAGTALPFLVIPHTTWADTLKFTLEGQYIFKNLTILLLAVFIWRASQDTDKRL